MQAFFSKYRKVVDTTVMVDCETGQLRGFGFVMFKDNSKDDQLIGKLRLILDDRQVWSTICTLSLLRLTDSTRNEVKMVQPCNQRNQIQQVTIPYTSFNNS